MADESQRQTDEPLDPSSEAINAAVAQFQRAALDAVAAARAMLDAAESVIEQPAAIEAVVNTVNAVARQATDTIAGFAATARDAASKATHDDSDDDGYEPIRVE